MPTIKTKFALDGEKAYKNAISEINSGLKVLKSEMNLVSEQYRDNGDSMEALTAKADVLERQYLTQSEKVEKLKKALEHSAKAYGEADKRTQQWRVSLNNEQAQLLKLERQMKDNAEAIEHYDEAQEKAQKNTTGLGDVIQTLADKAGIQLPKELTKAANGLGSVSVKALGVAAGIGTAIAAIVKIEKALIDMTKEAAEAAKQLRLLSSATNLSVESAQEWDYVLRTVGSSLEEAQGDLSALQEKMMDAAAGTGEGAELFGKLGISVTDASGKLKDTETILREVVTAMQLMGDETERNAISSALLGGTGEKLTALYDQESGALDDLIDKKRELGIASEAEVRELAKVSEAMLNLEEATEAAKTKVSAEFAPFLTEALEDISKLVVDLGTAVTESGLATTFGSMLSSVTDMLSVLGTGAGPVLKAFNALLQPIAETMALIADTATVIGGIFSLDWDMFKTGLGFNMSNGKLSNQQRLHYADALQTSEWDPATGRWSGNAQINPDDYVIVGRNADDANDEFLRTHKYNPETGQWEENMGDLGDWTKKRAGQNAGGTGNWRGGWTWVGENGPELMRLPQGSQVLNSQESRDYGGDTYNITIDAKSVKEFEDIVRIVQNQRRLRRMEGG